MAPHAGWLDAGGARRSSSRGHANAAPDLWSIRSVVIDLPVRVARTAVRRGGEPDTEHDLHATHAEIASPGRMQFRRIAALLAEGETAKATELASAAVVDLRPRSLRLCAEALEWLGPGAKCRREYRGGAGACGRGGSNEAFFGDRNPTPIANVARALIESFPGRQVYNRRSATRKQVSQRISKHLRQPGKLLQTDGETSQSIRDVEALLCKVAEVRHARGDLAGAVAGLWRGRRELP